MEYIEATLHKVSEFIRKRKPDERDEEWIKRKKKQMKRNIMKTKKNEEGYSLGKRRKLF